MGGSTNNFAAFDRLSVHSQHIIFSSATQQSTPAPDGLFEVYSASGSVIPFVVRSNESSQSADLTRWLAPNQAAVARVTAAGCFEGTTFAGTINTTSSGPTPVIDCSLGTIQILELGQNMSPTFINLVVGQRLTLYVLQGGSFMITWPVNVAAHRKSI